MILPNSIQTRIRMIRYMICRYIIPIVAATMKPNLEKSGLWRYKQADYELANSILADNNWEPTVQ